MNRPLVAGMTLLAAATLVACSGSQGSSDDNTYVTEVSSDSRGYLPGQTDLSPEERLRRSLSQPGQYGAARGVVRSTPTTSLANPQDPDSIITTWDFEITSVHGARGRLFDGRVVPLVVPGGEFAGRRVDFEAAPTFRRGQEVVVFVQRADMRDTAAGQSTSQRLVVVDSANVAEVTGEQVTWIGHTMDVSSFLAELDAHPSSRQP